MTVFNQYARYYDLLYREKDYAAEGAYVHELIRTYAPQAKSILELGCGTGAHAAVMAALGYRLHGVDRSPDMLDAAAARMAALRPELADRLSFSPGDIRTVRLDRTFDAMISLFHVMSYQTTDRDVLSSFATAGTHLNPGGIFIFDCWYGPGVLADRPTVRHKRFEDERIMVSRTAEPSMDVEKHTTDVRYTILIRDKLTGVSEEVNEIHRMRHFFDEEIDSFASVSELTVIQRLAWMSDDAPGTATWYACFVLQKQ